MTVVALKAKLNMVCSTCGSADVMRDAWAEWDVVTQDWTLKSVYDQGYCNTCEGETKIKCVAYRPSQD